MRSHDGGKIIDNLVEPTDDVLVDEWQARVSIAYSLEYGLDEMEMDDLLTPDGTAEGAVKLPRQLGAEVLAGCFIIDLPELGGADRPRKPQSWIRDCSRMATAFPG